MNASMMSNRSEISEVYIGQPIRSSFVRISAARRTPDLPQILHPVRTRVSALVVKPFGAM
jgi:hypothetical protein